MPRLMRLVLVLVVLLSFQVVSAQASIDDDDVIGEPDDLPVSASTWNETDPQAWAPLRPVGWAGIGCAFVGSVGFAYLVATTRRDPTAAPRLRADAGGRESPAKCALDGASANRLARSDRVAPRWSASAHPPMMPLRIRITNVGLGGANRVRTLGIVSSGPASAELHPQRGEDVSIKAGEALTVAFAGCPSRVSFHLRYEDDLGFTWWCPVTYWVLASPPVQLGWLERDRPA